MAKWGAFLLTDTGAPFYTPDSTPLALKGKASASSYSANGYQIASVSMSVDASRPWTVFIYTTQAAYCTVSRVGNVVTVTSSNPVNLAHDLTAYFFSIFPQSVPKWGIVIWDEQGRCILTNETRVLTDISALGIEGNINAGTGIDQTLQGKYAVQPNNTGFATGVIHTGQQPRPWSSDISFTAIYNGNTTRIASGVKYTAPGSVQGLSYSNKRTRAMILDVSRYD
ncbi:hypothetical protein HZI31_20700 [Serratia fonticola]|uniref:hypothetical protein n=1 Tax=Serratia fonticola TaxID=47917 RepID=UPI0015C5B391|nr:hypothetical protein [Serratia fonticola]NYA45718.1 hypothetical protein [Serratia fonticola]